jgi:hypothetical protein
MFLQPIKYQPTTINKQQIVVQLRPVWSPVAGITGEK